MLEEQLSNCHKRVETVVELENELRKKRQMIEEMAHVCRLKNWRMYQKFIIIFMIPWLKYVVLELIEIFFFYTGERFRQREAEDSNRRECTAAVWEKVQSEWKH